MRRAIYESAADGWRIAAHGRAAAALQRSAAARSPPAPTTSSAARARGQEAVERPGRGRPARRRPRARDRRGPLRRGTAAAPRDRRDAPSRLELLVGLAQALAATGRLEEALGALDEGLALVGPELARCARG